MKDADWKGPIYGAMLADLDSSRRILKGKKGIYIWRKVFRTNTSCLASIEEFLDWMSGTCSSPLLSAKELKVARDSSSRVTIRDNYALIGNLSIGQGSVVRKLADISTVTESSAERMWLYQFLINSSVQFGPVLYVGESTDLHDRLKTHIATGSDLQRKLSEIDLHLEDVAYFYCEFPDLDTDQRRALESVLTHAFNAPLTYRAG